MTEDEDVVSGARATRGRPVREVLAWSRNTIDPALRAAIDMLPASMRRLATYHFGWQDELGHPIEVGGGKAIRPALALLAADAVGEVGAAVPAGVAVELMHNYSLIHDDVMDGDTIRRHRPTVWNVFGINQAILAGDALLTLSFEVLARSGNAAARPGMHILGAASLALLDGQSADLEFEQHANANLSESVRMSEAKTGALMGCACALGALFGGGGPGQVKHLRIFGEHLGLAFQHVDDLLGIWGDPKVTGKPVYSDLFRGKKSLPVVAALTSGTPAGEQLAALYYRSRPLSQTDLIDAAQLIDKAGGRDWSLAQVDELLKSALRHLHAAGPAAKAADELDALARLATRRAS